MQDNGWSLASSDAHAVVMVPYFWMMDSGNTRAVWFGITLSGGCIYSALAGSQPAFFSELFPANLRYTGVAGAREFGAIAGGAIPLIATALIAAYASATPVVIFVICMCVVTIFAVTACAGKTGKGRCNKNMNASTYREVETQPI
jgi:MFS transporter, MHS family, shikimate and dehydroshikimate transport protein